MTTSHNARLSFLGKRAFLTYLMLFLHHHTSTTNLAASSSPGREFEAIPAFLSGSGKDGNGSVLTLEEKLDNLGNLSNLGRTVGRRWGLDGEGVMRWQSNLTEDLAEERDAGALKVYGTGVQAILGGTMMQFGSPAAQRLFHLHLLPLLAPQLRDQGLIQAVDEMRERFLREGGESCVVV